MKRTQKAGLVVEAAIVLPLFVFALLMFIYFFQLMELQLKLQSVLNQTAEQTASYGYLLGRVLAVSQDKAEDMLEESGLFSEDGLLSVDDAGDWMMELLSTSLAEAAFKQIASRYIDAEDVSLLRIVNGWTGVDFSGSCLKDDASCVVVKARYYVRIPFVPELFSQIELSQSAVCRSFCGDRTYIPIGSEEDDAQADDLYYITPNGSVYHVSRECSYLKITVLSVDESKIADMRNNSGAKYYPCERCAKGKEISGLVYYTRGGSSYHAGSGCSSLTRTVQEVSKEMIEGLPPCSRCGRGE